MHIEAVMWWWCLILSSWFPGWQQECTSRWWSRATKGNRTSSSSPPSLSPSIPSSSVLFYSLHPNYWSHNQGGRGWGRSLCLDPPSRLSLSYTGEDTHKLLTTGSDSCLYVFLLVCTTIFVVRLCYIHPCTSNCKHITITMYLTGACVCYLRTWLQNLIRLKI